ncbi:hypothetical protein [Pseudanabaena mucicola]|uniref:Replication restart DNA helicase PriA n=1 Tax=Pseudanabaena mucicola FACHB-723 TaxID=2692860 RepID=A0ABR7ZSV2_9CYAN|nr:hypothetical protein [Pseudanabaena mucicola]MBD2186892.1 hypothetical protein [Pseudanabaena mucicola FACHB-723]
MIESIRCPNCGSPAERHHLSYLGHVKTQCEECDYLLVTSSRSGHVLEFYAPGLPSQPRSIQPIAVQLSAITQPHSQNPHIRNITGLTNLKRA